MATAKQKHDVLTDIRCLVKPHQDFCGGFCSELEFNSLLSQPTYAKANSILRNLISSSLNAMSNDEIEQIMSDHANIKLLKKAYNMGIWFSEIDPMEYEISKETKWTLKQESF